MKHFVFAQVSYLLAFAVFPLDGANLSCGTPTISRCTFLEFFGLLFLTFTESFSLQGR